MVVLARLLLPEDFGLVTLATLGVVLLTLFSGLGLGGTLLVRHDLDARAQGTVLTLFVATGVLLALLLAAGSPLIAALLGEPRLAEVLAALAVIVFLSGGVNWFYEALLQRELEFRARFVSQVVQSVANAAVAIPLAALGGGVWSLVGGQIAGTALYGASMIALAPYHVRPRFDATAARDVMRTGRGFLLQGVTGYLSQNTDYIVIGRVLGTREVGFYSMPYRLSELPYWSIADPVFRVTLPGFARMRERGEAVVPAFVSALRLVALACCPLGVLLSATADPFTRVVFGEKWLPMIGPLAVLGIWGAVRPIQATLTSLLNSLGHAGLVGVASMVELALIVPALVAAAAMGGTTGVALVVLASGVLWLLVFSVAADRRANVGLGLQWQALRPVIIAAPAAWAVARGLTELTSGEAVIALVAATAAGAAAYATVVSLLEPRLLPTAIRQLGGVVGRSARADDSPAVTTSEPVGGAP